MEHADLLRRFGSGAVVKRHRSALLLHVRPRMHGGETLESRPGLSEAARVVSLPVDTSARIPPLVAVLSRGGEPEGRKDGIEGLEAPSAHERDGAVVETMERREELEERRTRLDVVGMLGEVEKGAVDVEKERWPDVLREELIR